MKQSNIHNYQKISANIFHVIQILILFFKFQKVYTNFFQVFLGFLNNNKKIKVILKNNDSLVLSARSTALTANLHNQKLEQDFLTDQITIQKNSGLISEKEKIIIHNGIENGDVYSVFIKNDYDALNVKGKTVVDIGANIGDSSIYFSIKGAKRVIGFEPFYNNFCFAQKNIEENSFSENCSIFLAGCSGNSGSIKLDPDIKSDVDSRLQLSNIGKDIPIYSLQQIISDFDVPNNSILKIDCEGCEYESILSASNETLNRFDQILIEYHHGYLDLKEKLKKCGFKVSNTSPISTGFIGKYLRIFRLKTRNDFEKRNKKYSSNDDFKNNFKPGYYGLIYAIKDI